MGQYLTSEGKNGTVSSGVVERWIMNGSEEIMVVVPNGG